MYQPEIRQVPVALLELEAVADEELVGDREADVAHGQVVDEPPVRTIEEGGDVQRGRSAERHRTDEVVHRHAGVDHCVDEDDVPALDLGVEVLEEANALLVHAVAGELDEVEVVVDRKSPRQVADEGNARFERSDEERFLAGVVAAQLGADLPDPRADLVSIEEDLGDALVELGQRAQEAFCNP